ncbi:hypothetical protein PSN45_003292 [Yamadazyma tenuis]|uniref:Kinetochore protein Sos7 coiled-coil domain-containing protein n=1 Tax=Candida tenuis (strain ATCC 10573 / BCRC 21748 / CBS 615 / JCM 9827 / NBRC 10315 / NRRL Y-1498 / VKM Y-70) TaxID=590646 RepID=G3AYQ3_CANTC|nr:uncharacterized protein CANTEDRAFT_112780 [Yamadazyma tenuis ATCC 10573]EGV65903.1 hypothetical protein CANTEDRAFT_112780 [Yamadazyma tenuis ATCC 10573]WEJ95765.1 hypothetical protein PSN45_003292 [Yamadazyma tenuis]
MLELDQNISLYNSKSEFRAGVDGIRKIITPVTIENEFNRSKERFERLKFTYLEQEARDKFLRIVLNEEQHDFGDMEKGNRQVKATLEGLENSVVLKQNEIEGTTAQLLHLYKMQASQLSKLNTLTVEISLMESEFEKEDIGTYNSLLNNMDMSKLHKSDNDNAILNYIDSQQNDRDSQDMTLKETNEQIEVVKGHSNVKESYIKELESKLKELQQTIAKNVTGNQDAVNDHSILGHWLVTMNKLLGNFNTFRLDTTIQDDIILLNFSKYEIKLNKYSLAILDTNANIDSITYNTSNDKVRQLSEIICKLFM